MIVVRQIESILGITREISTLATRDVVVVLVVLIHFPWLTVAVEGDGGAREKALVLVLEGC